MPVKKKQSSEAAVREIRRLGKAVFSNRDLRCFGRWFRSPGCRRGYQKSAPKEPMVD